MSIAYWERTFTTCNHDSLSLIQVIWSAVKVLSFHQICCFSNVNHITCFILSLYLRKQLEVKDLFCFCYYNDQPWEREANSGYGWGCGCETLMSEMGQYGSWTDLRSLKEKFISLHWGNHCCKALNVQVEAKGFCPKNFMRQTDSLSPPRHMINRGGLFGMYSTFPGTSPHCNLIKCFWCSSVSFLVSLG